MRRGKRTRALSLFLVTVLLALSGCASGRDAASGSPVDDTAAESPASTQRSAKGDGTKFIRLGSSPYAIRIGREFLPFPISNEDWGDDMVASYHNSATFLDFAVYQFSKEGYPDTLEEFVEQEAEEYDASEVVTGETVNGITMGRYRSVDFYGDVYRDGMTYVFENDDEYIEIDFWFIGLRSEQEARKIIDTLTVMERGVLTFDTYQVRVPEDLRRISGVDENPAVYRTGNASLRLYVSRLPANGMTLTDFVRGQGGSDIETDMEINGIPVASYRMVEALDRTFHSTLNYVLESGGGFTTLKFRLDGITAEAEAEEILETLTEYP